MTKQILSFALAIALMALSLPADALAEPLVAAAAPALASEQHYALAPPPLMLGIKTSSGLVPVVLPRILADALELAAADATIEPVWIIRHRARGPVVELGALGGGQEWAPDLAHVAIDWRF